MQKVTILKVQFRGKIRGLIIYEALQYCLVEKLASRGRISELIGEPGIPLDKIVRTLGKNIS